MGSYRGNSQVEVVNIFSLNSHATNKIVTCAERVIRRNTHTQLPDVESYRSNPPTESVNIFSLLSHHTQGSYLRRTSYKEKHTHTTQHPIRLLHRTVQNQTVGNLLPIFYSFVGFLSFLTSVTSFPQSIESTDFHLNKRTLTSTGAAVKTFQLSTLFL